MVDVAPIEVRRTGQVGTARLESTPHDVMAEVCSSSLHTTSRASTPVASGGCSGVMRSIWRRTNTAEVTRNLYFRNPLCYSGDALPSGT